MAKEDKADKGILSKRKKHENWFLRISLATAIVAALFSWVILIFVSVRPLEESSNETLPTIDEHTNCIDCKSFLGNFSQGPRNSMDFFKDDQFNGQGDNKMCCPLGASEFEEILEKIMDIQDSHIAQNSERPTYKHDGLPVAHKSILPSTQIGQVDLHTMSMNMSGADQPFEYVKGVQLLNNGMQISHPGMYFVYCSIHFRRDLIDLIHTPETWYLQVVKVRPAVFKTPELNVLLKALYTVCQDCREPEETVFTGGVFHLITGDQIQMQLSGLTIVDFSTQSTFLGVVMWANL